MSAWIVYSKDGLTERCELHAVEYGGTHMGERAVTATFESDSKVDFDIFDYLSYRGEVFELESVPTVKKTSSFEYSYELRFVSRKYELERCEMRDLVPSDNGVVYPTPLSFSFTGDVRYLTDRIQACLDDLYGEGVWNIVIADGVESEEKNITIAQQNCWNALALVNSTYGLGFYIKGRVITIGGLQPVVSHVFEYGKGNGLYEIERAANTDTAIVTKLRAYGSDRNLDYSYPKKPEWSDSNLPVSFAFSPLRLMLPSFKVDKTDYVLADEETIKRYGIREASIVYEDIYPSITGATHNGQAIDEIKAVEAVDDNASTFVVYLHDLGFDLEEHLTTADAQISMKSGAMQGYTFTISNIEKQEDNSYKITLGRVSAEGGENYNIPNSDWNMREGDKFVLLNILMPQKYIREAENRLKQRAEEYLAQYSKTNFGYNIGLHDKFLIENPSVYDSLIEGSKLSVYDEELGISEDVTIQSITITENAADNTLPQVKVTLNNEPSASTLDRVQGKIDSLANESAAKNFATQSEIMAQYRKKLDKPFFDKLFAAVDAEGNEIPSTDTVTPVAYIKARYDFAVVGGVTMYLNDGSLDLPNIFDGLPIDNNTIYWDGDVLKSRGVGEGGVTPTLLGDLTNVGAWANGVAGEDRIMVQKKGSSSWESFLLSEIKGSASFENVNESGKGNAFTSFVLSDDKKALTFVKGETFAKQSDHKKVVKDVEGKADKATTLSGYGIEDAYTKGETDGLLDNKANKGTTLASYGITNAYTKTQTNNLISSKWTEDSDKINNWDTAYGWGDHSAAGYATKATTLAGYGITNAYTKAEANILLGDKADWGGTLGDYGITDAYTSTEVDGLLEKYLPIVGGTITGNLRLRRGTEHTSPYIYFGDGNEVWLKEVSDTYLTIHADGGVKIDSPTTFVDGIKIEKSADGVLYIDADLVVKGGVTMFANEGTYSPSTIMDAVSVDNQTIIKQGGKLMVNPSLVLGGGGEAGSILWGNIIGVPAWITSEKPIYKYEDISGTPDLSVYALSASLNNYQSKITSNNKLSYSLIDGIPNLSVYALKTDLNGYQTLITESKKLSYSLIDGTPDLSIYAIKSDLSGYQIKITESNKLAYSLISDTPNLSVYATKGTSLSHYGISDAYTKTSIDSLLSSKWTKDDGKIGDWDDAYSWGNHAEAGYFKSANFTKDNIKSTLVISDWALDSAKPTYTTKEVSENVNLYFTNERAVNALVDTLKGYVTISGKQGISGEKDFTGGLKVNGSEIKYQNGHWTLEGDLLVTGAVTMFANEGAYVPSTIMDGVLVDNKTIVKQDGKLMVNPELVFGGEGGGEVNTVAWGNIIGIPSWVTTTKPVYQYTEILGTPDLDVYALKSALDNYQAKITTDNPLSYEFISGTPNLSVYAVKGTTLADYGIINAYTKTEVDSAFAKKATTLSGYGITDAMPKPAYNYRNGYLVKLSVKAESDSMISVTIRGNSYKGATNSDPLTWGKAINTCVEFYNYKSGDSIINAQATHFGYDFGDISVFNYDGYVYLWFKQTHLYQSFLVEAYAPNIDTSIRNRVDSITNSAMPTSDVTRLVTITPIKGVDTRMYTASDVLSKLLTQDGAGSKLDADLLDGHEGSYYASAASLDNYLPLSGGTVKGIIKVSPDAITGVQDGIVLHDKGYGSGESLKIKWTSESYKTGLSLYVQQTNETLRFENSKGNYQLWHSGNDGSESGLDADTLDGVHLGGLFTSATSSYNKEDDSTHNLSITVGGKTINIPRLYAAFAQKFVRKTYSATSYDLNTCLARGGMAYNYGSASYWKNAPTGMSFGQVLQLSSGSNVNHPINDSDSLSGQLAWDVNHNSTTDTTRNLWWRASDNGEWSESKWHQIAFTDSDITGNAGSATKLKNPRKIWGRDFDGTANVTGAIEGATTGSFSGDVSMLSATVNGGKLTYNKDSKYWKLEGDLLVTGGVSMFSNDTAFDPYNITDAVRVDNKTIVKDKSTGSLMINPNIELGGGLDETALGDYLLQNQYAKKSDIDTRINNIVNGAPAAYDTLKEIADVLDKNVDSVGDIITALGNKADKATTLSEYGITDAYTKSDADDKYLSKTSYTANDILTKLKTVDGANSGLDADSLDGVHASSLMTFSNINDKYVGARLSSDTLKKLAAEKYIEFWGGNGWFNGKWGILTANGGFIGDLTGNADTATKAAKLTTARMLWGQSFDGGADIKNASIELYKNEPSYTGGWARSIYSTNSEKTVLSSFGFYGQAESLNYAFLGKSHTDTTMVWLPNGNVGVGITNPLYKFDVNGSMRIQGTSIVRNTRPELTNSYSLGDSSYLWANLYTKKASIDGIEIKKYKDGVLYIGGNLVVSGSVTMYGTDGTTANTIWDSAPIASTSVKGIASFDSNFFAVNNGKVTFVGKTGGGVADSVSWLNVTGKPTWIGSNKPSYTTSEVTEGANLYFTNARAISALSSTLSNYLPLTGGTLSGELTGTSIIAHDFHWRVNSKIISAVGWYRFATSERSDAAGNTYILSICRNYANNNNESYLIAVTLDYTGISFTQLAGHRYSTATHQLVTKIRCTRKHSGVVSFDFYYNGTTSNTMYVNVLGHCNVQTPTATTETYTYTDEFELGNGVKSSLGFIGDLTGNADTATSATTATIASKLSTVSKTAWGQTYWTNGGVPTTISGNMSDVGNITPKTNNTYSVGEFGKYFQSGVFNLLNCGATSNNLWLCGGSSTGAGVVIARTSGISSNVEFCRFDDQGLSFAAGNPARIITKSAQEIQLKYNNAGSTSVVLNASSFKPFSAATGNLKLGSYDSLWNGIYLGTDSSSANNVKGVNFCDARGYGVGHVSSSNTNIGIYTVGSVYLRGGCTSDANGAMVASSTGVIIDKDGNVNTTGNITAGNGITCYDYKNFAFISKNAGKNLLTNGDSYSGGDKYNFASYTFDTSVTNGRTYKLTFCGKLSENAAYARVYFDGGNGSNSTKIEGLSSTEERIVTITAKITNKQVLRFYQLNSSSQSVNGSYSYIRWAYLEEAFKEGELSSTTEYNKWLDETEKLDTKAFLHKIQRIDMSCGSMWLSNPSNPYIKLAHSYNDVASDWYMQVQKEKMYIGVDAENSISIDTSGNLLSTGGMTMYSDIRKKTILNHVELSLKEVADAPLIEHYYNSDEKKTTHVGSVAQYWAGMNDWFCKEDEEGFLTMEIQNAALASAISVARELTRYESKTDKQIKKLKKRIGELEEEIENLKKL